MKRLLLIRHAKSCHDNPELSDHDRPLNKRGRRDIITMADWIVENEPDLELIVSSTAKRALLLAESFHHQYSQSSLVRLDKKTNLYTFSSTKLLSEIQKLPNSFNTIALVGHNPAITEVTNHLGLDIDNVPTSGIVRFNCDLNDWQDIAQHNTSHDGLISPKMLL